ncbi:MBL fold metallo-hydrolase [Chloroflexota bacterium]
MDPGHITTPFYRERGLSGLFKEMEDDGIEGKDIGLVILTHAHPDHCEAANVIKEAISLAAACESSCTPSLLSAYSSNNRLTKGRCQTSARTLYTSINSVSCTLRQNV